MCPGGYFTVIRSKNHRYDLRLRLVRHALEHGIRDAQRTFSTTRRTVRKWLRRYRAEGLKGLEDRSRRPHTSPNKTPAHLEREVVRQRRPA